MGALGIRFASAATWLAIACAFHGCASPPAHNAAASGADRVRAQAVESPPAMERASPELFRWLTQKLATPGRGWLLATGARDGRRWAGAKSGWDFQSPNGIGAGAFEWMLVATESEQPTTIWSIHDPIDFEEGFAVRSRLSDLEPGRKAPRRLRATQDGCQIQAADHSRLEPATAEALRLNEERWQAIRQLIQGRYCTEMRIAVQWESESSPQIEYAVVDWTTWMRCEFALMEHQDFFSLTNWDEYFTGTPIRRGEEIVWARSYRTLEEYLQVQIQLLSVFGVRMLI